MISLQTKKMLFLVCNDIIKKISIHEFLTKFLHTINNGAVASLKKL